MLTLPIHQEITTVQAPGLAGRHAMPQPVDSRDTKPGLSMLLPPQQGMTHVQLLKKLGPARQIPVLMWIVLDGALMTLDL